MALTTVNVMSWAICYHCLHGTKAIGLKLT